MDRDKEIKGYFLTFTDEETDLLREILEDRGEELSPEGIKNLIFEMLHEMMDGTDPVRATDSVAPTVARTDPSRARRAVSPAQSRISPSIIFLTRCIAWRSISVSRSRAREAASSSV